MPKPKCPKCEGRGLVIAKGGNRWCDCPAGRKYVRELDKARDEMAATRKRHGIKPATRATQH